MTRLYHLFEVLLCVKLEWKYGDLCSRLGGSANRFSIENRVRVQGALATHWGPPGAQCFWICTLVIDPFSWEWWVGEKTEGYSTKQLKKRVNEWLFKYRK